MLAPDVMKARRRVFSVIPDERKQDAIIASPFGAIPPTNREEWLRTLFPGTFSLPFAQRQIDFWNWIDSIEADTRPTPSAYINVEPRGGGKTTNAETAVIRLGALETRKFVLYVRSTQDKANESISNISSKLESKNVSDYYFKLSSRKLGKYGHSKGWTVQTLRCDNGFNVVGLGLDAAVRGVKLEDYRPDLIIFDDIDDEQDTPLKISKKIRIITKSIIPAGAAHAAYIVTQNLIHDSGIVAQLVDGTADFLNDRILSGPHKAVEGLVYEGNGADGYVITGGTATWEGQPIEKCQEQINDWGPSSFLVEAQHEVEKSGGLWDHIEFQHIEYDNLPTFERGSVWIDPAVTSTDQSDSMGICAGGVKDSKMYVVYSWEQITSPEDVIRRGILIALRYGFETLGVETDQGGDTWISVYSRVCGALLNDDAHPEISHEHDDDGNITHRFRFPSFRQAKAGAGHGSKVHRNGQMMVDYEHGKVYHVIGTHNALERALKRFPLKPLDLADTNYWLWYDLLRGPTGKKQSQPKQKSRWQDGDIKPSNKKKSWRM